MRTRRILAAAGIAATLAGIGATTASAQVLSNPGVTVIGLQGLPCAQVGGGWIQVLGPNGVLFVGSPSITVYSLNQCL